MLAIVQQVTKNYGSTYGGFASVLPDGRRHAQRRPAQPEPLRPGARHLGRARLLPRPHRDAPPARAARRRHRGGLRWSGVVYTPVAGGADRAADRGRSRSALLRGVRLRVLAVAACAAIALGLLVLPQSLVQRVDALVRRGRAPVRPLPDTARCAGARARTSPACSMWADHPLVGVGPDNFEVHYQTLLRGDRDRPATRASAERTTSTSSRSPRPACSERWPSSACSGSRSAARGGRAPASGARRAARRGARRRARRLPHLRPDPAQRLRALRMDLPRPRPRRRAAWRGGRRDDGRRGLLAVGRVGGVGVRRLPARAGAARAAAPATAAAGAARAAAVGDRRGPRRGRGDRGQGGQRARPPTTRRARWS